MWVFEAGFAWLEERKMWEGWLVEAWRRQELKRLVVGGVAVVA